MKKYIGPSITMILGLSLIIGGFIANTPKGKSVVYSIYAAASFFQPMGEEDKVLFHTGEILYPDYACPNDTLIVVDGRKLTEEMNNMLDNPLMGSDIDIDSVLHQSCVEYHKNSGLQPINFDSN